MAETLVNPPGQPVRPVPGRLHRGTLGRQLTIRVTALVALVALLITGTTALATWQVLVQQVDNSLDDVTGRVRDPDLSGRGPDQGLLRPGQPAKTFAVIFDGSGVEKDNGQLTARPGRGQRLEVTDLPDAAIAELSTVPTDGSKSTINLPGGLGRYRVTGFTLTAGATVVGSVVVGLPLDQVDETIAELLGFAAVLSLLAITGTVFAARSLVVRSLRPLNRVAATARQVSQLPLDRGEVALAVRVPPEDADPTSEVGQVGQALNHMLNNVEDALAARQASEVKVRQFVADASHELRNPLAAIRGYAELTRRSRDDMPTDAAYAMSRVESEADRMSRLVEDLLLLARLDSGPDLDVAPTDLTELVLNAVSDARVAGPQHSWQLALPDEPVLALGDRHRLHQVVANLLANARTHTPPGTRVETAVSVAHDQARITVTDTGPGIPPEIAGQVFERFTRADTSRVRAAGAEQGKSTGLGLAIVSAVVEAHQGSVTVRSEPGHTEFTITLPLAAAPVGDALHAGPGPDMRPPGAR